MGLDCTSVEWIPSNLILKLFWVVFSQKFPFWYISILWLHCADLSSGCCQIDSMSPNSQNKSKWIFSTKVWWFPAVPMKTIPIPEPLAWWNEQMSQCYIFFTCFNKVVLTFESTCPLGFEWVNLGLTSHEQRGNTEIRPCFTVSSERPKKQGIDLALLDWCSSM